MTGNRLAGHVWTAESDAGMMAYYLPVARTSQGHLRVANFQCREAHGAAQWLSGGWPGAALVPTRPAPLAQHLPWCMPAQPVQPPHTPGPRAPTRMVHIGLHTERALQRIATRLTYTAGHRHIMDHPHCELSLAVIAGWFMWYYTNDNPPVSCGNAAWPTGSGPQANASSGTYGACSPLPFQK